MPRIGVTIVTWNSARFLPTCLDALAAQDEPPVEVVVVDNGSTDASAELADRHGVVTRVDRTGANLGFAAGQNGRRDMIPLQKMSTKGGIDLKSHGSVK